MAFVARYGHQPISEIMRLPVGDLSILVEELAELLEREPKLML